MSKKLCFFTVRDDVTGEYTNVELTAAGALPVEIVGGGGGGPVNWGTILGALADQLDLQAALDAKAGSTHSHAESEVTNLVTDLAAKATPADVAAAVSAHVALPDPHATYQRENEKAAANGYPSLGANTLVPTAQLGGGTANGTTFLRGDQTWATPSGGGGGGLGYVVNVMAASLSTVTDAATYYFGCLAGLAPQTTAQLANVYIPKAGTITAAEIWCRAATAGTAENISVNIRLNNATDTLVATVGAATATRRFSNTALSIPVVVGDRIEIKVVCPSWATNPATMAWGGTIYVE